MPILSRDEFDAIVAEALDSVPEEFDPYLENLAVVVLDEPEPDFLEDREMDSDSELLGLYDGVPIGEKSSFDFDPMPDTIYIFQGPHERLFGSAGQLKQSRDELIHEIATTVLHEIAHHFGISDEELEERGYG